MSNHRRHLDRQARELRALVSDLRKFAPYEEIGPGADDAVELLAEDDGWNEVDVAPKSLGANVPVERWALAEYFLTNWLEWQEVTHRWRRYFGQSEEELPRTWKRTSDECSTLARLLLGDADLTETITRQWGQSLQHRRPMKSAEDPAGSLLHAVAHALSCQRLVRAAHRGDNRAWMNMAEVVDSQVDAAMERVRSLPEEYGRDVDRHLRYYCHSILLLPWLREEGDEGVLRNLSSEHNRRNVMRFIRGSLEELDIDPQQKEIAESILKRIRDTVGEIGYDEFAEDVASEDFRGGIDSPIGSDDINVIPSSRKRACCHTLVAVSRGSNKRASLGFPKIMQRVKTHLIDCQRITKLVIFLCDTWDADGFDQEHFAELAAHHRQGVRFVFLMVGSPRRTLAPVAVNFELGR